MKKLLAAGLLAATVVLPIGIAHASDCDIAILNGRVMDPETKFDGVRNVCVKDGLVWREEQAADYPQVRPDVPRFVRVRSRRQVPMSCSRTVSNADGGAPWASRKRWIQNPSRPAS